MHGRPIEQDFWILDDTMYVMGGARCDFVESVEQYNGRPIGAKEARQYNCGWAVLFVKTSAITVVARASPKEVRDMSRDRMPLSKIREYIGLGWRARLDAASWKQ